MSKSRRFFSPRFTGATGVPIEEARTGRAETAPSVRSHICRRFPTVNGFFRKVREALETGDRPKPAAGLAPGSVFGWGEPTDRPLGRVARLSEQDRRERRSLGSPGRRKTCLGQGPQTHDFKELPATWATAAALGLVDPIWGGGAYPSRAEIPSFSKPSRQLIAVGVGSSGST